MNNFVKAIEKDRRLMEVPLRKMGKVIGSKSEEKSAQISLYKSFLAGKAVTIDKIKKAGDFFHNDPEYYLRMNEGTKEQNNNKTSIKLKGHTIEVSEEDAEIIEEITEELKNSKKEDKEVFKTLLKKIIQK